MDEQQKLQAAIDAVEQMTETVRGMVRALVADGFSESQARDIVTGIFRSTK